MGTSQAERVRRCGLALLLFFCACDDGVTPIIFETRLIDAMGANILEGRVFERISVEVLQAGGDVQATEQPVNSDFDLGVVLTSVTAETRVRVRLDGAEAWVGAPPVFSPLASQGLVRIVAGPAGRCVSFDTIDIIEGDRYARIDTFLISAGGSGLDTIRSYDLLQAGQAVLVERLPSPGPVAIGRVGPSGVLFVGEETLRIDLAIDPADGRSEILTLHNGAGAESTVTTLSDGRALVVGPGSNYSVVEPDLRVVLGTLVSAHERALVLEGAGGVFVFGPGAVFAEMLDLDRGTSTAFDIDGSLFTGPVDGLIVEDAFLLIDDEGNAGRIMCDGGRVLMADMPQAMGRSFGVLRVGDAVTRVEGFEPPLVASRTFDTPVEFATRFESGIALLIGDAQAEICFPFELDPL